MADGPNPNPETSPEPRPDPSAKGGFDEAEITPEQRRSLWTVAFTLFLDLAGFGIILPVLPLYAERFASAQVVALLSTAFSLTQFAMSPVLGRLSDRFGRRPVMLISIGGSVAAALVLAFSDDIALGLGLMSPIALIFVARLVAGASKANVSTAQAYVGDIVPPKKRAKYMGMMGAALGMGFIFGPAIGGFAQVEGWPTFPFLVSAVLSAVNFVMAYFWLPETHHTEGAARQRKPRASLSQVIEKLRAGPLGWIIIITFCFYFAFAAMESVFALFADEAFGWKQREIGFYLTFLGLNMALIQGLVVGRIVDRIGEARVLITGLVVNAVGLSALGASGLVVEFSGPWALTLGLALLSATCMATGNGFMQATTGALISRVSNSDEQGVNMGLRESSGSLARITGPILAGFLFQRIDVAAPFFFGSALTFVNVALAFALMRSLSKVDYE